VIDLGLKYPGGWKFEGIGFGVSSEAVSDFSDLIVKIADGSKSVIELFKSNNSSSYDWAVSDLSSDLEGSSSNAAEFVDKLWQGIESAKKAGAKVPSHKFVNSILEKHGIPLRIDPPNLVMTDASVIIDAGAADKTDNHSAVPRFVLGEQIGNGGYGVVHRATKSTVVSDFEYALKILDPSPFVENYEKALARFQREIKALQSLQHRAIIQYFEAGLTGDNKPYIVMPFIVGNDLRAAASEMDLGGVVAMFIEILNALDYAHSKQVIHRDLKPSNVIVRSSDTQPIILDFGCAYVLDDLDSKSLTNEVVGTVGYIPSEVLMNPKKRSKLHDVYACGVMLYESLAGYRPDPANYKPLSKIDSSYAGLDPIIRKAIAGEGTRITSAKEFASQLRAFDLL
jgi:hypothetical protein